MPLSGREADRVCFYYSRRNTVNLKFFWECVKYPVLVLLAIALILIIAKLV